MSLREVSMARKKHELNFVAPIIVFVATWLVQKTIKKARKSVDRKRGAPVNKEKNDTLWQLGITIAVALTELIVNQLLVRTNTSQSKDEAIGAKEIQTD